MDKDLANIKKFLREHKLSVKALDRGGTWSASFEGDVGNKKYETASTIGYISGTGTTPDRALLNLFYVMITSGDTILAIDSEGEERKYIKVPRSLIAGLDVVFDGN